MFSVGDVVKPDALSIVKDHEACGLPSDGMFDELDASRGVMIALQSNPRFVTVRWSDGMTNSQEATYLIKVS